MTNAKSISRTFKEIEKSLRKVIIKVISEEAKSLEANWFVGLTDSDKEPVNANQLFHCCNQNDTLKLKEHILNEYSNRRFVEGEDYGTNQTIVYIIAEY
jgi:hypothetical protein